MEKAEIATYLRLGLKEVDCWELDCARCGIVRVVGLKRPETCPVCHKPGEWHGRDVFILTKLPVPQVNVIRRPVARVPRGMHDAGPYNRVYAANFETRYSLQLPG